MNPLQKYGNGYRFKAFLRVTMAQLLAGAQHGAVVYLYFCSVWLLRWGYYLIWDMIATLYWAPSVSLWMCPQLCSHIPSCLQFCFFLSLLGILSSNIPIPSFLYPLQCSSYHSHISLCPCLSTTLSPLWAVKEKYCCLFLLTHDNGKEGNGFLSLFLLLYLKRALQQSLFKFLKSHFHCFVFHYIFLLVAMYLLYTLLNHSYQADLSLSCVFYHRQDKEWARILDLNDSITCIIDCEI